LCHIKIAGKLMAGDAFLRIGHQANAQELLLQGNPGLLENGPGKDIEAALAGMAVPAANAIAIRLAGYMQASA